MLITVTGFLLGLCRVEFGLRKMKRIFIAEVPLRRSISTWDQKAIVRSKWRCQPACAGWERTEGGKRQKTGSVGRRRRNERVRQSRVANRRKAINSFGPFNKVHQRPNMKPWPTYQPRDDVSLVFRARPGGGGLGDRVVGIISAFVLAILTQRQFRIDWTTPIPLAQAWGPVDEQVSWDALDHPTTAYRELLLVDRMPGAAAYFLGEDVLHQADDCVAIEANQHFFTHLLQNPHLQHMIRVYEFPAPDVLSKQVLAAIFQPSEGLETSLQTRRAPLRGTNSIGVQVRTLWNWGDAGGCIEPTDFQRFFACVRKLLSESEPNVIFVSADDRRVTGAFREAFPDIEVLSLAGAPIHLDRSANVRSDEHLATFTDLHLLAECRHLVISPWSNFGRVAALLSDRPVWVVRKSHGTPYTSVPGDYGQVPLLEMVSKEGLAHNYR